MSAPHFLAGAPEVGAVLALTGDDARHAAGSRRLRAGEELTSSDGRGALVRCVVRSAAPDRVEAEVVERTVEQAPVPAVEVHLAPPKGDRLAWAVQKLTELGVDAMGLLETDRSVRRWDEQRRARAVRRLAAVVREAAKQSRRRFLPAIEGPAAWDDAVVPGAGRTVILWEGARRGLLELLPEDHRGCVRLLVGPEGGIPEADARAAEASGAILASLGPTILRTETAAVAAAAVALARYRRLGA